MFKGTIKFSSDFRGPLFESFAVDPTPHRASEITLESSEADGLSLIVRIDEAASVEKLVQQAEEIASFLRTMLSVIWEAPIKDFQIKEHSFEEVSAEPPTPGVATGIGYLVLPGITLKGYGTVIRQRLDDAKVARLKDRLESKLPTADFYYQKMFIAALDSDDTVARFMMLYLIGLSLFGESQQQFDTEIRRLEPSVTFSPGHSGRPESVYTKLRNQIGHVRPGTTIDQTRGEMSQRLRGLTNIIKQLLDERAT